MTDHVPVLIVGAGISGLVCAYALRKAGIDTLLVESATHPGGVIRSERREGFLLELGPQSFSGTPPLLDLCRDLHIERELLTAPPDAPRYLLLEGKLQPVPLSPPAFLRSSLFSARTKWKLLRDALGHSAPPRDDESIANFVRRKFTEELLDKLVGPFVSGIYAGDPEKLSLRAAFPQVHEAEASSGSVIRGLQRAATSKAEPRQKPTVLSFRDGNETLTAALATSLRSSLRCETSAKEIRPGILSGSRAKFEVALESNQVVQQITANHVVLAAPARIAAHLLRSLDPLRASDLSSIEYAPIAVVSLGYERSALKNPLDGFGFLVPRSAALRTLGAVWNSSLFTSRSPERHVLLTGFLGGVTDPQAALLPTGTIEPLVHKEIAPLLSIERPPCLTSVTSYRQALPQYNLGHSERVLRLEKPSAASTGIWLAGNYLHGPSIGACIQSALSLAAQVASAIKQGHA